MTLSTGVDDTGAKEGTGNLPEVNWQVVGEQMLQKSNDYLTALIGGEEKIYIAIEGIAASLLSSDAFLPSLLDRLGSDNPMCGGEEMQEGHAA